MRMTAAQKTKMRKARERALKQRQRREESHVADFHTWLRLESEAYSHLRRQRAMHGDASQEAADADRAWLDVLSLKPTIPPDSAFRRVRGDHDD